MCHAAVIWVFNQALKVLLDRPVVESSGTSSIPLSLAEAILAYMAVLTICFTVSVMVFYLIEQPCRSLSRRMFS